MEVGNDLSHLDITIFKKLEEKHQKMTRQRSRYKFAEIEPPKKLKNITDLIHKFMNRQPIVLHDAQNPENDTDQNKEFRLFNQSYTIPKKSQWD